MRVVNVENRKRPRFKAVMAAEGTTEELMELHNLFLQGKHKYTAHLHSSGNDTCLDIFATEADANKLTDFNCDELDWFESFSDKEISEIDQRMFFNKNIGKYITLPDRTVKASEVVKAIKAESFDMLKLVFKK